MKGDFFSRLAEKTLGVAPIAKPDLMPVFVTTPENVGISEPVSLSEETMRREEQNRSPVSGMSESVDLGAGARETTVQSRRPAVNMSSSDDGVIDRERETRRHEPRSVEFRQNRYTADVVWSETPQVSGEFNTREKISLADRIAVTAPTAPFNSSRMPSSPAPPIHISIGRVEVRAVAAPTAAPKAIERKAPPRLSLDQYLRERNEGRR